MSSFRVAATGHSINYLPEYVAVDRGFFAEEGLSVDAVVPDPWSLVLNEIKTGTSKAAIGGIWVPAMYHGRGRRFLTFAQMSARCPMVLVGRKPETLRFESLVGKTVLVPGGNGISPAMVLQMLLQESGVDIKDVHVVQNLSGKMLAEMFTGGAGDYLQIDPVSAMRLTRSGDFHVVSYFAQSGGPIPWSVYYAEGTPDETTVDEQVRFTRALGRGMQWVIDHPADSMHSLLARLFPDVAIDDVVTLVDNFRAWGMWNTPRVEAQSYARWQEGIAASHLTEAPIAYDTLVNTAVSEGAGY